MCGKSVFVVDRRGEGWSGSTDRTAQDLPELPSSGIWKSWFVRYEGPRVGGHEESDTRLETRLLQDDGSVGQWLRGLSCQKGMGWLEPYPELADSERRWAFARADITKGLTLPSAR